MFEFVIKSISFLLLFQISSLTTLSIRNHIYGGESVGLQGFDVYGDEIIRNDGEFPYMAAIDENGSHICGGAIIRRNAILTAAHCVHGYDPKIFKIRAGTLDVELDSDETTQTLEVVEIASHPRFRASDNLNDIAIMWLKGNFTFDKYVNRVKMSTLNGSDFVGEMITAIGWGSDGKSVRRTATLKKSESTVISLKSCKQLYWQYSIPNSTFCAIHNDNLQTFCRGDSGGPIVQHYPDRNEKDVLVGLTSSGSCKPALPTLFTDVGRMHKWVLVQLRKRRRRMLTSYD